MKVRLLVDVPRLELKGGEYYDLPDAEAKALVAAGEADPKAPWPEDKAPKHEPAKHKAGKP